MITEFNEVVVDRIIVACEPPRTCVMIKSFWKNRKDELPKAPLQEDVDLDDEGDVIPKNPAISEQELERAYLDYEKLNGIKITDFCKERNIPEEQFRNYRKIKTK